MGRLCRPCRGHPAPCVRVAHGAARRCGRRRQLFLRTMSEAGRPALSRTVPHTGPVDCFFKVSTRPRATTWGASERRLTLSSQAALVTRDASAACFYFRPDRPDRRRRREAHGRTACVDWRLFPSRRRSTTFIRRLRKSGPRRFDPERWLVTCLVQQVQVPAGMTPAEFVIQRRFFFSGLDSHAKSERRVTAPDVGPSKWRSLAPTEE